MVTSLRWSLLFQMLHATVTLLLTRLRVSRGQKFQDQPQVWLEDTLEDVTIVFRDIV